MANIDSSGSARTNQLEMDHSDRDDHKTSKHRKATMFNRKVSVSSPNEQFGIKQSVNGLLSKIRGKLLGKRSTAVANQQQQHIQQPQQLKQQPEQTPEPSVHKERVRKKVKPRSMRNQKVPRKAAGHKRPLPELSPLEKVFPLQKNRLLPLIPKKNPADSPPAPIDEVETQDRAIPLQTKRPLPSIPTKSSTPKKSPTIKTSTHPDPAEEYEKQDTMAQFLNELENQALTKDSGYSTQSDFEDSMFSTLSDSEETTHEPPAPDPMKPTPKPNYNYLSIQYENMKKYPAREILDSLENPEDTHEIQPGQLSQHFTKLIKECTSNSQWINNRADWNMVTLKRLKLIIKESTLSLGQKQKLENQLTPAAVNLFTKHLPSTSIKDEKKEIWRERLNQEFDELDTLERIMLENSRTDKLALFNLAYTRLAHQFGIDQPMDFQRDRLIETGKGDLIAFELLCQDSGNPENQKKMADFIKKQKRISEKLQQLNNEYQRIDDEDEDDNYAELLELSNKIQKLEQRMDIWPIEKLAAAERILHEKRH